MIYKLQLSNKENILIDEEEYTKFKNNIDANFIQLKKGIVNPSFVVSITVDPEATAQENKYIENQKLQEEVVAPMDFTHEDIQKLKEALTE